MIPQFFAIWSYIVPLNIANINPVNLYDKRSWLWYSIIALCKEKCCHKNCVHITTWMFAVYGWVDVLQFLAHKRFREIYDTHIFIWLYMQDCLYFNFLNVMWWNNKGTKSIMQQCIWFCFYNTLKTTDCPIHGMSNTRFYSAPLNRILPVFPPTQI
jgi:hypothetical protein